MILVIVFFIVFYLRELCLLGCELPLRIWLLVLLFLNNNNNNNNNTIYFNWKLFFSVMREMNRKVAPLRRSAAVFALVACGWV